MLGKCRRLRCGQPLSVDLDHRVSGGQEKRRQIGVEPASETVMSTSRRGPGRGGVYAGHYGTNFLGGQPFRVVLALFLGPHSSSRIGQSPAGKDCNNRYS